MREVAVLPLRALHRLLVRLAGADDRPAGHGQQLLQRHAVARCRVAHDLQPPMMRNRGSAAVTRVEQEDDAGGADVAADVLDQIDHLKRRSIKSRRVARVRIVCQYVADPVWIDLARRPVAGEVQEQEIVAIRPFARPTDRRPDVLQRRLIVDEGSYVFPAEPSEFRIGDGRRQIARIFGG